MCVWPIFARELPGTRSARSVEISAAIFSLSLSVSLSRSPSPVLIKTWRKTVSHAVWPTSGIIIIRGCNRTSRPRHARIRELLSRDISSLCVLIKQSNFFVSLIPARGDSNAFLFLRESKRAALYWIHLARMIHFENPPRTNYFKLIKLRLKARGFSLKIWNYRYSWNVKWNSFYYFHLISLLLDFLPDSLRS